MLDPSYKVEPKYAMHTVVTDGGQVLSGVVTAQDGKTLTIVTNPEAPQPQVVQRDEIDEIIQSTTSMMPKGLLDRYSREEIFELLAYIISP
jgi:putative heme-binding domain-containing protein